METETIYSEGAKKFSGLCEKKISPALIFKYMTEK